MSRAPCQLVVLARWPAPMRCKRRLAIGVGPVRAAAIQARLTHHVLQVAASACSTAAGQELVLAVDGLGRRAAEAWGRQLGAGRTVLQGPGGLGLRLRRQLCRARHEGATSVLLIGSDLPGIQAADLQLAWALLLQHPLVLGPALDGGYWLIGLSGDWPELFAGHGQAIPWGSDQVLQRTREAAAALDLPYALLPCRADLDRNDDLRRWR